MDILKYKVLGGEDRQRINGNDQVAGDIIEMTPQMAEFYLREGRIELVADKTASDGQRRSGKAVQVGEARDSGV